jgi:carbonic anhydrase
VAQTKAKLPAPGEADEAKGDGEPAEAAGEAHGGAGKEAAGHGKAATPGKKGQKAAVTTGLAESLSWGSGGKEIWHELEAGNERFVSGHPRVRDLVARRGVVAGGQHPPAMVLTCSDSRLPPELLLDQGLGDLFVVRTAGNVIDSIAIASFEYAAEHLGSRLLLVLGHEKCGAVTAAVKGGAPGSPHLKALVAEISPAVEPLRSQAHGDDLIHKSVAANALREAMRLREDSPILKELAEKHQVEVMAAVYDLESGKITELEVKEPHHEPPPAGPAPAAGEKLVKAKAPARH